MFNNIIQEFEQMNENKFIKVDEVAKNLEVSIPYAYKIIRQLNSKLSKQKYLTISVRVNCKYFYKKLYGENI